ncbi:MAG: alanine racemase [Clostridia bacterium]|nr:alanine racemase [Clostridia bacterium]
MKAVIDLNALLSNAETIRSKTKAKLYAVVKANAYGHGMAIAAFLQPFVDGFCVATEKEAETLVKIAVYKPILILGKVKNTLSHDNIIYTVEDIDGIKSLKSEDKFYIKLNTGMNRLGCSGHEYSEILTYARHSNAVYCGTYTHFFNFDDNDLVNGQYTMFKTYVKNSDSGSRHCCSSNVLRASESMHGDIVRVGLALYGYSATSDNLKPVMKVYAPIVSVKKLLKGDYVGYGSYRISHDANVAVIRAGYGDGYRRVADAAIRYVSVNGVRRPVIGQICMDMCMIDLGNVKAEVGDYVGIMDDIITAETLAKEYGTIVYEVLTSFNERVERIYVGN